MDHRNDNIEQDCSNSCSYGRFNHSPSGDLGQSVIIEFNHLRGELSEIFTAELKAQFSCHCLGVTAGLLQAVL